MSGGSGRYVFYSEYVIRNKGTRNSLLNVNGVELDTQTLLLFKVYIDGSFDM